MTTAFIGQPVSRVDGRHKVTGGATYAAEFNMPRIAHGAIVRSTVANGRIASIDSTACGTRAWRRGCPHASQRAAACLPSAQRRRRPRRGRATARAAGRPRQSPRPADRARDRRDARTGESRGNIGARHLCT